MCIVSALRFEVIMNSAVTPQATRHQVSVSLGEIPGHSWKRPPDGLGNKCVYEM